MGSSGVPISVRVRDERHRHIAWLADVASSTPGDVPILEGDMLPLGRYPDFPLLAYVDPYGDTCFNRQQARALLAEMVTWADQTPDPRLRLLNRAAEILVAAHMRTPHRYLWFIGD